MTDNFDPFEPDAGDENVPGGEPFDPALPPAPDVAPPPMASTAPTTFDPFAMGFAAGLAAQGSGKFGGFGDGGNDWAYAKPVGPALDRVFLPTDEQRRAETRLAPNMGSFADLARTAVGGIDRAIDRPDVWARSEESMRPYVRDVGGDRRIDMRAVIDSARNENPVRVYPDYDDKGRLVRVAEYESGRKAPVDLVSGGAMGWAPVIKNGVPLWDARNGKLYERVGDNVGKAWTPPPPVPKAATLPQPPKTSTEPKPTTYDAKMTVAEYVAEAVKKYGPGTSGAITNGLPGDWASRPDVRVSIDSAGVPSAIRVGTLDGKPIVVEVFEWDQKGQRWVKKG